MPFLSSNGSNRRELNVYKLTQSIVECEGRVLATHIRNKWFNKFCVQSVKPQQSIK